MLVVLAVAFVSERLVRTGFTGLGSPNLPAADQNTQWRLTGVVAAGSRVPDPTGASPTLLLRRHNFAITGDCNDESGPLSVSGTKLTFRVERGSMMACSNAPLYALLGKLVRGPAYLAVARGSLTLRSRGATFTFSEITPTRP